MAAILRAHGLMKRFGAVTAAAGLEVGIDAGSVVGLIGGNGAGKTTFINLVTGYLKPDAGSIEYAGRDITRLSPRHVTRLGICRSFQIPQLFDSLTVRENLRIALGIVVLEARRFADATSIRDAGVDRAAEALLAQFRLGESADRVAGVLPEGVRKLVDVAMAMAAQPKLLLLDEPTSGVSAGDKFVIMDMIMAALVSRGVTILFIEHDMEIVRRYTERVLAFHDGRIIADGASATVLDDDAVRRHVIGERAAAEAET